MGILLNCWELIEYGLEVFGGLYCVLFLGFYSEDLRKSFFLVLVGVWEGLL